MKVTYEELAKEQVRVLNIQCEKSEMNCIFELVTLKPKTAFELFTTEEEFKRLIQLGKKTSTKNYREIRLYLHDLLTGERIIAYKNQYVADNPSVFLKPTWKEALYKEYVFSALKNQCLGLRAYLLQAPEEDKEIENTFVGPKLPVNEA